jgi:hypothetical protein
MTETKYIHICKKEYECPSCHEWFCGCELVKTDDPEYNMIIQCNGQKKKKQKKLTLKQENHHATN